MSDNSKKRKNNELPRCKYGSDCYRKNPEHRKKFRHSDIVDSPSKKDVKKDTESETSGEDFNDSEKNKIQINSAVHSEREMEITENNTQNNCSAHDAEGKESVGEILKNMPQDFFDFWNFCCSLNKTKPEDALSAIGFHLVGIYDLLSKNIKKDKMVNVNCHWRYYYDPPEFQTVVQLDGNDLYHIGYFRDNPDEMPSILASNSAKLGPKLTLKGDNIFAAINFEISDVIKSTKDQKLKSKLNNIQDKLKAFAKKNNYSLELQTPKTKARAKKVVSKTFHGLGIVVPVKNDIGYRPLPDSDATVRNYLKRISSAEDEDKQLKEEENLDELITNVQFANDECDYGMGLELGIDLFCFGHPYFHSHIKHLLPLAYDLLKRPKYANIVKEHLANRKKSDELNCLDI